MFEGTTKNANMQENVQFLFRSRGERYVVKRHELRHSISCYKKKSCHLGNSFCLLECRTSRTCQIGQTSQTDRRITPLQQLEQQPNVRLAHGMESKMRSSYLP